MTQWTRMTAKQTEIAASFEKEALHLIGTMSVSQRENFQATLPDGVPIQEQSIVRLGVAREILGMALSPFVRKRLDAARAADMPKQPVVLTLSQSLKEAGKR